MKYALSEATGATIKNVSLKSMRNFKINLPKLDEQSRIVAHLDVVRAETDRLASLYEQKLADLDELRRSVLQEAFAQGT
jgi:type I restriction enzyme S subunit